MLILIGEEDSIDPSKVIRLEKDNELWTLVHFENGTMTSVEGSVEELTDLINKAIKGK